MFTLICARMNGWVNNGEAGDLRRNRVHYDVIVMYSKRATISMIPFNKLMWSQHFIYHGVCTSVGVHYNDFIITTMASQIAASRLFTQPFIMRRSKKHQSSASLAFVRGIHRWPVNSPHKGSVTRKMFPFDDVIIRTAICLCEFTVNFRRDPTKRPKGFFCPGISRPEDITLPLPSRCYMDVQNYRQIVQQII